MHDLVEPLKSVHTWVNLGTKLESCKVSIPDIPFATTVACISHDVARLYFIFFRQKPPFSTIIGGIGGLVRAKRRILGVMY